MFAPGAFYNRGVGSFEVLWLVRRISLVPVLLPLLFDCLIETAGAVAAFAAAAARHSSTGSFLVPTVGVFIATRTVPSGFEPK